LTKEKRCAFPLEALVEKLEAVTIRKYLK